MSTQALALGSPRSIECLPCTLQPNAVHMAAPPSNRRLSFLTACLVYTAMASGLVLMTRHSLQAGPCKPRMATYILEPDPSLVPAPPVQPAISRSVVAGPTGGKIITPEQLDNNKVPDYTPDTLPTENHSGDHLEGGESPVPGTGLGIGIPDGTRPAILGGEHPVTATAPVQMDLKDLRVLSQVQPVYPGLAKLSRQQGPVVLLMTIDPQGVPSDVQLVSGPYALLSNEALRVARLWRFEPARVDGRAVSAQFRLTVVFKLGN